MLLLEEEGVTVDVLLTDVLMPHVNGLVLVDEVIRRGYDFPVIYMSGLIQGEANWSGISGNVRSFLEKPIDLNDLSAAVQEALGAAAAGPRDPDHTAHTGSNPPTWKDKEVGVA